MPTTRPLFDINHIIALLDLTDINKKYNEFKSKITHYCFKKNEFGGYIVKEFISEESMYNLILSSNSEFSKAFKQDVSKLLVNLRNQGVIAIVNDEIMVINDIKNHDITCLKDRTDYDKVSKLFIEAKNIILTLYVNDHLMYAFATTLIHNSHENKILLKIGYTADISKRIVDLKKEYGCNFFLLAIRIVKNEQYEHAWHTLQRNAYPQLVCDLQIKNKNKDEIYVYDDQIIKEFFAIKSYNKSRELEHALEMKKEETKQMEEQTKQLQLQLELKKLEFNPQTRPTKNAPVKHPQINKLTKPKIKPIVEKNIIEEAIDLVDINPIVEVIEENNDNYDLFSSYLNDRTIKTDGTHVHLRDLYNDFIKYHTKRNQNTIIPKLDEFRKEIKKHCIVEEGVHVRGLNQSTGIKHLSINPKNKNVFAKKIGETLVKRPKINITDSNMYTAYFDERTEGANNQNIHITALYEDFCYWLRTNKPSKVIPDREIFRVEISKLKPISPSVSYKGMASTGIANIKFREGNWTNQLKEFEQYIKENKDGYIKCETLIGTFKSWFTEKYGIGNLYINV